MNEPLRRGLELKDLILPSSDLRLIKEDADLTAASIPEREGLRTLWVLGFYTSQDRRYDPQKATPFTPTIVALAERRQREWVQRSLQNPARATDLILASLQTNLKTQAATTKEPLPIASAKLAHEVNGARATLRYLQEEWRDQLDLEIAQRIKAGQPVDETVVAQDIFVTNPKNAELEQKERVTEVQGTLVLLGILHDEAENLFYSRGVPDIADTAHRIDEAVKFGLSFSEVLKLSLERLFVTQVEGIAQYGELQKVVEQLRKRLGVHHEAALERIADEQREERARDGVHFTVQPWDNVRRLVNIFGLEVDSETLFAQLTEKAQAHQFGFGFSDLATKIPEVTASLSKNTQWGTFGLSLHFSPEAKARIALAPLLPIKRATA